MLRYIKLCLRIGVILAGFLLQCNAIDGPKCDAVRKATEDFKNDDQCNQWKLATPWKNQAIMVKLSANNFMEKVKISNAGDIFPQDISCVIYRPRNCDVTPIDCTGGILHVMSDTHDMLQVSTGNAGDVRVSYKLLTCSETEKSIKRSSIDTVVWVMASLAMIAISLVCIICIVWLKNEILKSSSKKTTAETYVSGGDELAMVKVESHRKELTSDCYTPPRPLRYDPYEKVTVFDGKPHTCDGDTSEEDEPANQEPSGNTDITQRIAKQGAEKHIYVDVEVIRRRRQDMLQKSPNDSDDQEGESSNDESEEDEGENATTEKKADGHNRESCSSSDGEQSDTEKEHEKTEDQNGD